MQYKNVVNQVDQKDMIVFVSVFLFIADISRKISLFSVIVTKLARTAASRHVI
jgi:hypothetical protein